MAKVKKRLRDIPRQLPAAEQLARALQICSAGMVPDYGAFHPWLANKLKAQSGQVPALDPLGARQSFAGSFAFELARLREVMRAARETGVAPDFTDFVKFKLLLSFSRQSKRGEDVVASLLTTDNFEDRELTDNLSLASPAQLRMRLFAAMSRNRGHDAFMLLGRIEESDLDAGEYAFLRSLCHFRSGQFKEAIEYSSRVPLSAPDGPRAVEIHAKSHAYLGNGNGVKEAISVLAQGAITTCQVLHLAELTVYHSGRPQEAETAVGGHPAFEQKLRISDDDAGFGEFQKFHVRLLTAFAERCTEVHESVLLDKESSEIPADWSAIISSDPILQRSTIAVALEPGLVASADPGSLPAIIFQSLYRSINEGDREAGQILFQSLYRLGAYQEFMTHFKAVWPEPMRDEGWFDLLGLAYQVAVIQKDPLASELRAALNDLSVSDVQASADETASRYLVASRLTPMGREAYRIACHAIDAAAKEDMLWRDAGLLALGFFRIIEVEFNERLIRPVANSIALPQLEALIAAASIGSIKPWKEALKLLKSVISHPSERLMLGALRKICDDFAHPPPQIDSNLRVFIQSAFDAQLTPDGRSAFYSQQLIDTISPGRVTRYRNPPAHGRFVGMSEAKTCQRLVTDSLKDYFAWFVDYAVRGDELTE
jgi:hypothetical protein